MPGFNSLTEHFNSSTAFCFRMRHITSKASLTSKYCICCYVSTRNISLKMKGTMSWQWIRSLIIWRNWTKFSIAEMQNFAERSKMKQYLTLPKKSFPQIFISRWGCINWPSCSPKLTPIDFFLLEYLKSRVYISNSNPLVQFKENICQEMPAAQCSEISRLI